MNFKVGQKVLCVHTFKDLRGTISHPIEGQIYTVRGIYMNRSIYLEEVINPPYPFDKGGYGEACWRMMYFRPLDEIAQGVTMTFEKLKEVQPIYQS